MKSFEWQAEMYRVIAPHLAAMLREIERSWPTMDGELILLYYLCVKNKLEAPIFSFRKRPMGGEEVPPELLTNRKRDSAKADDRHPPERPPQRAESGRREVRATDPLSLSSGQDRERPGQDRTLAPLQRPVVLPATAKPQESPRCRTPSAPSAQPRHAEGGEEAGAEEPARRPGSADCSLKFLSIIADSVQDDVRRSHAIKDHLKLKSGRVTHMVSQMRQDLRGKFLSKVPILSPHVFSMEVRFKLVGKLRPWTYARHAAIIKEGEIGDKMYIIEFGSCEAIKEVNGRSSVVAQLGTGAFFGEIAVLYDIPRTATVRAASDVTVLSLSRDDLLNTISEEEVQKMRTLARAQVFCNVPLLTDLTVEQKTRIAQALKRQKWLKGSLIEGHNHITSRIFFIEQGCILMSVGDGQELPSFMRETMGVSERGVTLGPGQFFGMRGLLYGAPVGFNITAKSDEVWTMSISLEEMLATGRPEEREAMSATMHESMRSYLLKQIPQLRGLADSFFNTVKSKVEEVHYKKWTVIYEKGHHLEAAYVLEKGKLAEYDGDAFSLKTLSSREAGTLSCPELVTPGTHFGSACLTSKRANATSTLVTLTDVVLLRILPQVVWSVLQVERQHLARIPLFSQNVLSKAEQYMLVGKLQPWNFAAGQSIIREGDMGDMLYIIEAGVCDAFKEINGNEVLVSQMKKGAFFGELAVLYDVPRTATVRAATEVTCVSLSRDDLFSSVSKEKIEDMHIVVRTQVFCSVPILANLTASQKIQVAKRLRHDLFFRGATVVRGDDPTERLYIIESGVARMELDDGTQEDLVPGQHFGSRGLLHGAPYGYSVTVTCDELRTLSVSLDEIYQAAATGEQPQIERALTDGFRVLLLKQIPRLQERPDEFYHGLLNHMKVLTFAVGAPVFCKGMLLGAVYVLERGRLEAQPGEELDSDIDEDDVHEFAVSDVFGAELLEPDEDARTEVPLTLVAATECSLLRLPPEVVKRPVQPLGSMLASS